MKRCIALAIATVMMGSCLTGCIDDEKVPEEKNLSVLNPLNGKTLEKKHEIEKIKFTAKYDTGDYDLSRWRITDSKVINLNVSVKDVPEGTTIFIEHVHIDMSLKSRNAQLDGLSQDYMDDSYHGSSQDGFLVNEKYVYQNKFAIEGFSKDLIEGWSFACGSYGTGSISQERLTERNLIKYGNVYANKMQVVYDVLVKHEGEKYFHVVSILDEFLIPVGEQSELSDTSNQSEAPDNSKKS